MTILEEIIFYSCITLAPVAMFLMAWGVWELIRRVFR